MSDTYPPEERVYRQLKLLADDFVSGKVNPQYFVQRQGEINRLLQDIADKKVDKAYVAIDPNVTRQICYRNQNE